MTVQTQIRKITVDGNGSATVHSFSPIVINKAAELIVTHVDANNVETVLSEGQTATTYSVTASNFPTTGSITYPAMGGDPLPSGEKLIITRVLTLEQQTDLENQGGYNAEVQEKQYDRFIMIDLQQQELLDRALVTPISDTAVSLEIPNQATRANKYLTFDASGIPTATDAATASGTSVLATGSTTARLLADRAAEIYNVLDYGAKGDGVADDAAAVQAAVNAANSAGGGVVLFPSGTYLLGTMITVGDNTTVRGIDRDTCIVKLHSSHALNTQMFRNADIPAGLDNRTNVNVRFENLTFSGGGIALRAIELISFAKAVDCSIFNCYFLDHTYISVADLGSLRTVITDCVWKNCGRTGVSSPALWAQSYPPDSTDTTDIAFMNNIVIDNIRNSGVAMHANGGRVIGNLFTGGTESAIFITGNGTATNPARNLIISNNVVQNNTVDDVTAAGLEINTAANCVISDNIFDTCGAEGMGIQNLQDSVITGNIIRNCCQEVSNAAMSLTQNASLLGELKNVTISNNTFIEDQGSPTQDYILKFTQAGTTPALATGIKFIDNHIEGGFGTGVLLEETSRIGPDAIFQDFGRGMDNLLYNGKFDIGQRGTTFAGGTTPANNDDTVLLDRWILLSDGNDIVDVSRDTATIPGTSRSAAKFLQTATTNKKWGILQILPSSISKLLRDDYLSLEFWVQKATGSTTLIRAAILQWTGTADAPTTDVVSAWNASGTQPTLVSNWFYLQNSVARTEGLTNGEWVKHRFAGQKNGASCLNLGVFIWSEDTATTAGDTTYIGDVRLCHSHLPVYPQNELSYEEDFMRCRRFYEEKTVQTENGSRHIYLLPKFKAPTMTVSVGSAASATVDGFELTHTTAASSVIEADSEF